MTALLLAAWVFLPAAAPQPPCLHWVQVGDGYVCTQRQGPV